MASDPLPAAPQPKGPLGRYRLLSPTASVRVSPLCLGAMNFGDAWKGYMGSCDKETTEAILDFYYDQGGTYALFLALADLAHTTGNFIDTSNNYQFEESEMWIGEWMERRKNRDQIVLATKFTTNFRAGTGRHEIMANFAGNGSKSLHVSVEASLRKLRTTYIDLLYVHWWDYETSVPELMQSLNQLVLAGKVLYLGISDSPAWVVSKANEYARCHGLRQFSVYQGRWSAASRDFERDIIPMARVEGMGLAPWGALGGGAFKTEEQRRAGRDGRNIQPTKEQVRISKVLEAIADRKGSIITSVALAYVMHKAPYVFPIVGGRTIDHLKNNVEALSFSLDEKDVDEIESAAPFDLGFPHSFLWRGGIPSNPADVWLMNSAGTFDHVPVPRPIGPAPRGD